MRAAKPIERAGHPMLVDLKPSLFRPPDEPTSAHFAWHELAFLWNSNDLAAAHDWLNERWSALVRNRVGGHSDPEAQFLQALAFAVLALHFTQHRNQEGARLMLDDALVALTRFRPAFLGVSVDPILDTLKELQPLLAGLAAEAECPRQPFEQRRFEYERGLR
jgi:hypothetical protein